MGVCVKSRVKLIRNDKIAPQEKERKATEGTKCLDNKRARKWVRKLSQIPRSCGSNETSLNKMSKKVEFMMILVSHDCG
jgi:hypothetical protein